MGGYDQQPWLLLDVPPGMGRRHLRFLGLLVPGEQRSSPDLDPGSCSVTRSGHASGGPLLWGVDLRFILWNSGFYVGQRERRNYTAGEHGRASRRDGHRRITVAQAQITTWSAFYGRLSGSTWRLA